MAQLVRASLPQWRDGGRRFPARLTDINRSGGESHGVHQYIKPSEGFLSERRIPCLETIQLQEELVKLLHEQEYANKPRSILRDYGNSGLYPEPKNLTLNPLQLRQELNLNNSGLYPES